MIKATTKQLGLCQVGSKTEHPCTLQATAEFHGIPFCGSCAREQEVYFAMGELTQEAAARDLSNEPLVGVLRGTRGSVEEPGERKATKPCKKPRGNCSCRKRCGC